MLQRELSNINITVNVNTKLSSSFRFTLQLRFRIIQFPISYATSAQCYVAPIRIGSRCSIMADKNSYIFYYAKTLISYRTSENTYFLHFVVHSYINNLKNRSSYRFVQCTNLHVTSNKVLSDDSRYLWLYKDNYINWLPVTGNGIVLHSSRYKVLWENNAFILLVSRLSNWAVLWETNPYHRRTTTVFYDPQGNAKFSPVSHLDIYMSPRNIFRFILFSLVA